MRSKLMLGEVRHRRYRPVPNEFRYKVLYLDLAIDELPYLDRALRLFSHNRFNIYALNDRDHHGDGEAGFIKALGDHVVRAGGDPEGLRIITQPSAFGYVFNPVSFFVPRVSHATPLVIAEVHNRHRGRHLYDMWLERHQDHAFQSTFAKEFYVSPFIPMQQWYEFAMEDDNAHSVFSFQQRDEEGILFQADLDLTSYPLNDYRLARALVTHPVVPWKTLVAIYLQAIKLKLRGVPYFRPGDSGGNRDVAS